MYTPGQYPDPTLDAIFIDFQNQITANLNKEKADFASTVTQVKQVTLTLESELDELSEQFTALQAYVKSKLG